MDQGHSVLSPLLQFFRDELGEIKSLVQHIQVDLGNVRQEQTTLSSKVEELNQVMLKVQAVLNSSTLAPCPQVNLKTRVQRKKPRRLVPPRKNKFEAIDPSVYSPPMQTPESPELSDSEEPMEIGASYRASRLTYRRSKGLCFYCGDAGHLIGQCPVRPPKRPNSPQSRKGSISSISHIGTISTESAQSSQCAAVLTDLALCNKVSQTRNTNLPVIQETGLPDPLLEIMTPEKTSPANMFKKIKANFENLQKEISPLANELVTIRQNQDQLTKRLQGLENDTTIALEQRNNSENNRKDIELSHAKKEWEKFSQDPYTEDFDPEVAKVILLQRINALRQEDSPPCVRSIATVTITPQVEFPAARPSLGLASLELPNNCPTIDHLAPDPSGDSNMVARDVLKTEVLVNHAVPTTTVRDPGLVLDSSLIDVNSLSDTATTSQGVKPESDVVEDSPEIDNDESEWEDIVPKCRTRNPYSRTRTPSIIYYGP